MIAAGGAWSAERESPAQAGLSRLPSGGFGGRADDGAEPVARRYTVAAAATVGYILPVHLSFDWALRNYQGRLPDRSLPVATDGAGNLIYRIDSRERTPGWYGWDHDNEWDAADYREQTGTAMPPQAKYQNVYFIAESFSGLLERAFVFIDD